MAYTQALLHKNRLCLYGPRGPCTYTRFSCQLLLCLVRLCTLLELTDAPSDTNIGKRTPSHKFGEKLTSVASVEFSYLLLCY